MLLSRENMIGKVKKLSFPLGQTSGRRGCLPEALLSEFIPTHTKFSGDKASRFHSSAPLKLQSLTGAKFVTFDT
jgi:hypothetical protein